MGDEAGEEEGEEERSVVRPLFFELNLNQKNYLNKFY